MPLGQDGTGLAPSDFVLGTQNLSNRYEGTDIAPDQERVSALLTVRSAFTDRSKLSFDLLRTGRDVFANAGSFRGIFIVPDSFPYAVRPEGETGPIRLAYDFRDELGPMTMSADIDTTTASARWSFDTGTGWSFAAQGSYAREDQRQSFSGLLKNDVLETTLSGEGPVPFNPFDATSSRLIPELATKSHFELESVHRTVGVEAHGMLPKIGLVASKLNAGLEIRQQSLESTLLGNGSGPDAFTDLERKVESAYAEVLVPLSRSDLGERWPHRLEASLATRFERYDDFGNAETWRLGLLWSPMPAISFRTSIGKSLRPPALTDLVETWNTSFILPVVDRTSPTGTSEALIWSGKNADLKPETARSWTIGVDVAPIEGLNVGLTYFDVRFRNRIELREASLDPFSNPASAETVNRDPTMQDRQRVCSRSTFSGVPADCLSPRAQMIADYRLSNIGRLETRGVDVSTQYAVETKHGKVGLGLIGSYVIDFEHRGSPSSDLIERVNTQNNPLRFRVRGSGTWEYGPFGAALFLNYANAYDDVRPDPHRRVESLMTVDLNARFSRGSVDYMFGIENAFDERAPFMVDARGIGYDPENAELAGRRVTFGVKKKW